ncbi:TetR family transcriptional regulator [Streptomyces sp. ACA25]|uniref:TetR/AcrR family transcriptional regulator n=1 Tax=Streptomyces sp. ACA25 TaxID=3022596 RepID=UPI00230781F6|nr:TetR family transcriptional regulator [Streptomyces sp. ACA25]MDB1088467.1 TetR family transcriptional regulator [Streptomyces sp. ACA25]
MARRYDPDRRERIVSAAVRVVGERGIAGLSHRAVAAEADVPLGSTTYHFSSLDDLLVAALRQVNDGWLARVAAWVEGVDPGVPLADETARFVAESLAGERSRVELEYELYFAGLRRTAVRPLAAQCLDDMAALLRNLVPDEATARAMVALLDGLMLQLVLTGRPCDPEQVSAAFGRLIPVGGTGSPSPRAAG